MPAASQSFQAYARAIALLRPEAGRVAGIVLAGMAVAGIQVAEPVLFGHAVNALLSGGNALSLVLLWGAASFVSFLSAMTISLLADRLMHRRRLAAMATFLEHVLCAAGLVPLALAVGRADAGDDLGRRHALLVLAAAVPRADRQRRGARRAAARRLLDELAPRLAARRPHRRLHAGEPRRRAPNLGRPGADRRPFHPRLRHRRRALRQRADAPELPRRAARDRLRALGARPHPRRAVPGPQLVGGDGCADARCLVHLDRLDLRLRRLPCLTRADQRRRDRLVRRLRDAPDRPARPADGLPDGAVLARTDAGAVLRDPGRAHRRGGARRRAAAQRHARARALRETSPSATRKGPAPFAASTSRRGRARRSRSSGRRARANPPPCRSSSAPTTPNAAASPSTDRTFAT